MSEKLRQLYTEKHRAFPHYGESAKNHIEIVKKLIAQKGYKTFLDYGCGKAILSREIPSVVNYDFAIPEYSHLPDGRFDLAFCIDVLEHIPEEELDETFRYLKAHSENVYFCVHMGESIHKLANGEPCHCTVKPAWWWISKLGNYWTHTEIVRTGKISLTVLCSTQG